MVHSLNKGKRAERQWRDVLKDFGFSARRGQQFSGSPDSPDVISPELAIHWEVKHVEKLNIHDAVDQAVNDCGESIPVVAHRKNNTLWMCTLQAHHFLTLIKALYESNRNEYIKVTKKDS